MTNLLYIGNQLKHRKGAITYLDVLGPLLENEGYHLVYSSSKANKFLRLLAMMYAVFLNRKKADYVLIDTYSTLNFYYALFVSQVCRFLRLKYLPILHGGHLPNRLRRHPKLCELIFKNAYKNIAPSNYMRLTFEAYGYSNVITIPNVINIHQYPFKPKDYDTIRLLWVRSFSKIYNPLLAVKVLKTLKDEGFQALLCMVGPDKDGSLQTTKDFAASLNVKVEFTGKLTKQAWIDLSHQYNIFINTSDVDNMPVSVIEAMALGLVIVSTHVGGMPFLIKNGYDGVLVNPDDVQGFVTAIKTLKAQTDQTIQLTLNARKKVENYSWDKIKPLWFSLFE
ncbi:glycosyltransferase family 4 protein [Yeosuana sp. AK3]